MKKLKDEKGMVTTLTVILVFVIGTVMSIGFQKKSLYNNDKNTVLSEKNNSMSEINEITVTEEDGILEFEYDTANKTATVIGLKSNYTDATDVKIPNYITYNNIKYKVVSIGITAFAGYESLTSVTIPNSVTSIGDYAFYNCSSLTSITIPDSITSMGDYAFESCSSLTSITIPDSVTSIGDYAFFCCSSLTSITIPDSVTSIGEHTFSCCSSLTSITIPDSVISIGGGVFSDCSNLTDIYCKGISTKPSSWNENWLNNCQSQVHWNS